MQPTYLPWVGYFDLIDQSDIFVFLDTVQFEKQSWQQRNRIKTAQGAHWLTVPVRQSFGQKIVDVAVDNTKFWGRKHWSTIEQSYSKAPYFHEHHAWLEAIYKRDWPLLADLDIQVISALAEHLGIVTKFVRASALPTFPGVKGELLAAMCEHLGADTYLSPIGARTYLTSDAPFAHRGVRMEFHAYDHPAWRQQHGEFVPFLSALDLIVNAGASAYGIIRSGRRPAA
jgi:hypothetical protein